MRYLYVIPTATCLAFEQSRPLAPISAARAESLPILVVEVTLRTTICLQSDRPRQEELNIKHMSEVVYSLRINKLCTSRLWGRPFAVVSVIRPSSSHVIGPAFVQLTPSNIGTDRNAPEAHNRPTVSLYSFSSSHVAKVQPLCKSIHPRSPTQASLL